MTLLEKLQKIQYEMKAPKNLRNTFGNYNYRNAEGIMEAFKPYGEKYKVVLVVSDLIKNINDKVYVEATATLFDVESDQHIKNIAYAREASEKKGMDPAQVTGATSSYARKYALNGLFLLDDTKDPDTDEYQKQTTTSGKGKKAAEPTEEPEIPIATIGKLLNGNKINEDFVCGLYKVATLEGLTQNQRKHILTNIDKIKAKQEEKHE